MLKICGWSQAICKVAMAKSRDFKNTHPHPPKKKKKIIVCFHLVCIFGLLFFPQHSLHPVGRFMWLWNILYNKLHISNAVQILLYEPHNEVGYSEFSRDKYFEISFSSLDHNLAQ